MFPPHPKSISPRARPQRMDRGDSGGFEYFLKGRVVARVYFHATGAIDWEMHFDETGRMHGLERHEFENGATKYQARWVHGLQHGLQKQWNENGQLLVATRFHRGTGVDLWFDCDRLSEERTFVAGRRHGVERWWATAETVWHESYYSEGLKHGIEREWTAKGRLIRGFPRYFLRGEQVTKRQYEKGRLLDPTLLGNRAADNLPNRRALSILAK